MRRKYPKRLLPLKRFKTIEQWPSNIGMFYVTRATERNIRICSKAYLRCNLSDHIQASRFLNGLSVNMISIYKRSDSRMALNYKHDDRLSEYWVNEKEPIQPRRFCIRHFHSGYFGFQIKDLQSIKLEDVELKNGETKNGRYNLSFKLFHKPTCSNFWHCEFHIYGESVETDRESGTMLELKSKGLVSGSFVTKVANIMMDDFADMVKSKNEIKRRRLYKIVYL